MIFKVSSSSAIVTTLALLHLFVAVLSISSNKRFSKRASTNELVSLGSVEGRAYFAETSSPRSWSSSQQICQDTGMHLASIKSKGQADFIKKSAAGLISSPYFWLGGRDSQKMPQLVWDFNNETPVDGILVMDWRAGAKSCLALFTARNSNQRFEAYACDGHKPMFTLCEKADGGTSEKPYNSLTYPKLNIDLKCGAC